MAKGKSIIVAANPRGCFLECVAGAAISPGHMCQLKSATEPDGTNRHTWEVFNGAADGEQTLVAIAIENRAEGKVNSDAYAADDRVSLYCPIPGEEMNVLVQASAGALVIGGKLIVDDSTGTFILTTGTPESEPFLVLETASDPGSDTLIHVIATGS